MSIAVKCRCGQKFNAKDQLAGKTVKCPNCSQPLTIPQPGAAGGSAKRPPPSAAAAAPLDSVFDEVGLTMRDDGTECPDCGYHLPPDAVLCINCGYNFQTQKRLQTLGATEKPVLNNEERRKLSETEKMLLRAEDELEKEPVKQDLGYGSASSAWMLTLLALLIAGSVIAGGILFFNYMEGEEEQKAPVTSTN